MTAKSNQFENDLALFIFNGTALPADYNGPFWLALCTSDPGEAATGASMNEIAYTNYARQSIARTSGGFTVTGGTATNAAQINFPTCGVTGGTATHWALVTSSSGAGRVLYKGALDASRVISSGDAPFIAAGSLAIGED